MELHTLHVFGQDYSADLAWKLLEWCRHHGAVEFTVDGLLVDGGSRAAFEQFDRLTEAHRLPPAPRYDVQAGAVHQRERWHLNDVTVAALRIAFPLGFFSYEADDAWHEDLAVYRNSGELMLGVVTHESEGVLRLTAAEKEAFAAEGFPTRPTGEWVGVNEAAL
ncbi:MAG: hypothetical protein AB7N73_05650 [Gemmatimonadales bacterium]